MTTQQHLTEWQHERRAVAVPSDFASTVMRSIAAEIQRRNAASRTASIASALALAAGILLVLLCQATSMGWALLAMKGVAQ